MKRVPDQVVTGLEQVVLVCDTWDFAEMMMNQVLAHGRLFWLAILDDAGGC